MQRVRKRLIHIHACRGVTRRILNYFLRLDPTLKKIYTLDTVDLINTKLFSREKAHLFLDDLHDSRRKKTFHLSLKPYDVLTILDSDYPVLLRHIYDPPVVLYLAGHRHLLQYHPALSVIGTRNPSQIAKEKIEYILPPLLKRKWLIVSGMAKGIDSFAHKITLDYNQYTIAVLGGGFKHIYPRENERLFRAIQQKGLVISEYPPHVPPRRYHFPERNRIISGLSFGTLVIEARERSGTLITVDQALEQGREVYAVPGSPLTPETRGCLRMIQDGAKVVVDALDILEDWQSSGMPFLYEQKES